MVAIDAQDTMAKVLDRGSSTGELPTDVLAGVLQHLDEKERLQCCALVCKKWQLAANLATDRVVGATDSVQSVRSLSAWLNSNSYVSRLQSIQVKRGDRFFVGGALLWLPLGRMTQLRALQLSGCQLEVVAAEATVPAAALHGADVATQPRSLAALTALSKLELCLTALDLSDLRSCTQLQHLDLNHVTHVAASDSMASHAGTAAAAEGRPSQNRLSAPLAAALPHLTQLTYLSVRPGVKAIVPYLSTLPNLQELKLSSATIRNLAHLPTSLVSLQLTLQPRRIHESAMTVESVPQLLQLTRLQHLDLSHVGGFDPVLLYSLTQLTWLHLDSTDYEDAAAVAELMLALRQLTLLRHLDLAKCLTELEPEEEEVPSPDVYAALAASSHLTHLNIADCWVPSEATGSLFAAADALPNLRVLTAGLTPFTMPGSFERLVVCCPALEQLDIQLEEWAVQDFVGPDEDVGVDVQGLAALAGLQQLTKLSFYRIDMTDDAMNNIGNCVQLRDLTLITHAENHTPLTAVGMMHLTQLAGLTRFKLEVEFVQEEVVKTVLVSHHAPPDVHLQLRQILLQELLREVFLHIANHFGNVADADADTDADSDWDK